MLRPESFYLVVVDVQGRLANIVEGAEAMRDNVVRLIEGAKLFGMPIICTEQVPDKLGETVTEVADALGGVPRLPKETFSCWGDDVIRTAFRDTGRRRALVCGIEAHVCVYQTVRDLLADGYEVHLVKDAIASRSPGNKEIACTRMASDGANITSTEMALFELQHDCRGDRFRALSRLVK